MRNFLESGIFFDHNDGASTSALPVDEGLVWLGRRITKSGAGLIAF